MADPDRVVGDELLARERGRKLEEVNYAVLLVASEPIEDVTLVRDVRRTRDARRDTVLEWRHERTLGQEKRGPIDELLVGVIEDRAADRRGIGVATMRGEDSLHPVGLDVAVIFRDRNDLAACGLIAGVAQLEDGF